MNIKEVTRELEADIRLALRFDLGWGPDEARSLAAILAGPVTTRMDRRFEQ